MKKIIGLASAFSTLAMLAACSSSNSSTPQGSSSGNPPAADGGADGAQDTDGGTTDGGPTSGPATSCSTATLFAGNPVYDGQPSDRPTSGTAITADPPLQWENLVFVGKKLFTRDTGEIWVVDTSAAKPVETLAVGKNDPSTYAFAPGACATARLGQIEGLAAMADGSLVASDNLGNAVVHIKDPTGPGCSVEVLAGNTTPNPDIDPSAATPNAGDADGPAATAKINVPGALTTDDAGNVYFFDRGNRKIKKISGGNVTTLATLPTDGPDKIPNLTRIGSTLYAAAFNVSDSFVLSLDTAGGSLKTILSGRGDKFPPVDDVHNPNVSGITTDGKGLILSGSGYVWYLTPADAKLTLLAGAGLVTDYPPSGYDPKAQQKASDVLLPPQGNASLIGSSDYITYDSGAIYVRGHKAGTAAFVERISCP